MTHSHTLTLIMTDNPYLPFNMKPEGSITHAGCTNARKHQHLASRHTLRSILTAAGNEVLLQAKNRKQVYTVAKVASS